MTLAGLSLSEKDIESIAKRWRIQELAVFGSAVRKDFSEDNDIDVLVQFKPDTHYSLFDLVDMKDELESLFGRPVHLVEKSSLKNPFRKKQIFQTARTIHEGFDLEVRMKL